ncbi:MAG: hypothetical protein AB8H80_07560 [Planctomycetota bacterium]
MDCWVGRRCDVARGAVERQRLERARGRSGRCGRSAGGRRQRRAGGGANARVDDLALAANGDLIAAGRFTALAGLPVGRIARWDATQWSDLAGGAELSGSSFDVASVAVTLPGGDLLVAGEFDSAGGTPVRNCARYDGSA